MTLNHNWDILYVHVYLSNTGVDIQCDLIPSYLNISGNDWINPAAKKGDLSFISQTLWNNSTKWRHYYKIHHNISLLHLYYIMYDEHMCVFDLLVHPNICCFWVNTIQGCVIEVLEQRTLNIFSLLDLFTLRLQYSRTFRDTYRLWFGPSLFPV